MFAGNRAQLAPTAICQWRQQLQLLPGTQWRLLLLCTLLTPSLLQLVPASSAFKLTFEQPTALTAEDDEVSVCSQK